MNAIQASGMIAKGGNYNAIQFKDRCGINPLDFPQYFKVHNNGLVSCKQAFADYCKHTFQQPSRFLSLVTEQKQLTEVFY